MSNTFNDQCGFSLHFFFLRQWLCTNYRVMFPAITVPFFFAVSMTTMTCLAPPTEGGRLSQSFPLRQNAFSPIRVFFLFFGSGARTAVMTIAVSRPQFVYPVTPQFHLRLSNFFLFFLNGGKFRARVWFKSLQRCLVFWCLWGLEIMSCLTIATTAAPAPARAQTNRWKVMSSCGEEKKKENRSK